MSNADRQADILRYLANDNMTHGAPVRAMYIRMWLGEPYYFDQNLAALVEAGKVKKSSRWYGGSFVYEYSLAK